MVADNAYDPNAGLQAIAHHQDQPVIPPKTSRNEPHRAYYPNRSADRNLADRFFEYLKEGRGCATCYDKTATSFLAAAPLLAALNGLR